MRKLTLLILLFVGCADKSAPPSMELLPSIPTLDFAVSPDLGLTNPVCPASARYSLCFDGVGICKQWGVWECHAGVDFCPAQRANPETEICDGLDNDCDGRVDENVFIANPGCVSGLGVCAVDGSMICVNGSLVCDAQPNLNSLQEDNTCNEQDDDCDGVVDEGFGGVCSGEGVGICRQHGWLVCEGLAEVCRLTGTFDPPLQSDLCGYGDEDCDSLLDEDEVDKPCQIGRGVCERWGLTQCNEIHAICTDGNGDEVFAGNPISQLDNTCDLVDDDCDGAVDEDYPCNGTVCSVQGGTLVPDGMVCIEDNNAILLGTSEEGFGPSEFLRMSRVTQPFWILDHEVTRSEWSEVIGDAPYTIFETTPESPVTYVSISDAATWLNAKSRLDGYTACYILEGCQGVVSGGCGADNIDVPERSCNGNYSCASFGVDPLCTGYRLPTRDEWEHAARLKTTPRVFDFPFNSPKFACGDFDECMVGFEHFGTQFAPTRRFQPYPNGLHDIHSNVSEWVLDELIPSEVGGWFSLNFEEARITRIEVVDDLTLRRERTGFRYIRNF